MGKFNELRQVILNEEQKTLKELNDFLIYNQKEVKVLAKGYGEIKKQEYKNLQKKKDEN